MADYLDKLELSVRAQNLLRNAGVTTREQFFGLQVGFLRKIRGMGSRTINEIMEAKAYELGFEEPEAISESSEQKRHLLDTFAMRAMGSLLPAVFIENTSYSPSYLAGETTIWPGVARDAYKMADAMMQIRKEIGNG